MTGPLDPLRAGRLEPRDASLRGLAEELVEAHTFAADTWWKPARGIHWRQAQAALMRHGWWGDLTTVRRLRAHIAAVQAERERDAA